MKVQTENPRNRKTMSNLTSTPLSNSERQKSRRSTASLGSESSDKSTTDILFEMVMSDPKKRALVEKLLHDERDKIEAYKKKEEKKAYVKNKRVKKLQKMLHCESPTALFRRRALEEDKLSNNGSSKKIDLQTVTPSTSKGRPFEKLLFDVVAYVEVKSHGKDCSAGAKALMQAMGATIKDNFSPQVTHVIFKDGSYSTFKTAKLLKIHVVSVLWLEAVRKSGMKLPEKNYPALGAEYENISQICEDYESVINEEYHRSLVVYSQSDNKTCETAFPTELEPLREIDVDTSNQLNNSNCPNKRRLTEIIPSSQAWECESIISCESGTLPFRKPLSTLSEDEDGVAGSCLTSDDDSDCGFIDGHSFRKSSQPSQLDTSLRKQNDIDTETSSTRSKSLLRTPFQNQRTSHSEVDMELTENLDVSENKENVSNATRKGRSSIKIIQDIRLDNVNVNRSALKKTHVDLSFSNDEVVAPSTSKENIRKNNSSLNSSTRRSSRSKSKSSAERKKEAFVISDESQRNSSLFSEDTVCLGMSTETNNTTNQEKKLDKSKDLPNKKVSTDSSRTTINSNRDDSEVKKKISASKRSTNSLGNETSKNNSKNLEKSDLSFNKRDSDRNTKSIDSEERYSLRMSEDDPNTDNNQEKPVVENLEKSQSPKKSEKQKPLPNPASQQNDNQLNNRKTRSSKNLSPTRSKDDSYLPNKKAKINENETMFKSERKPKQFRKLYNLNQTPDEEAFKDWNETAEGQNKAIASTSKFVQNKPTTATTKFTSLTIAKTNELIKKTLIIPLTPIKVTPSIKKLFEASKTNKTKTKTKKVPKSQKTKTKPTQKSTKKVRQLDNSKDEQKDLISEYVTNKKKKQDADDKQGTFQKPIKVSINRRLFSPRKNHKKNNNDSTILPLDRRSSLDFTEAPPKKTRLRRLVHKIKNPSIVCTRLHRAEVQDFVQIVQKLGNFSTEDEVSRKTTHLVVGESKRTINLLRAIARGCWIVSKEWLFRSLEASKWLPEEDFELTEFSPAIQQCRLQRQAFGPFYSMDIFAECGPIYVSPNSIPRHSDLRELIELCKGVISKVANNASVVVGDIVRYENVTCVNEKWVLDSITFNKRKSFKNYIIQ